VEREPQLLIALGQARQHNCNVKSADQRVLATFAAYLRVEKGLSARTIEAYLSDVAQFSEFQKDRSLASAKREHVRAFLQKLHADSVQPRSVGRKISALRALYRHLLLDNAVKEDPTLNIEAPAQWKVLPKSLRSDEIDAMVASRMPKRDRRLEKAIAVRDRAILETLYAGAVRVSEVVDMKMLDLRLDEGLAVVRGKGDKERIVPLGEAAVTALREYLKQGRPEFVKSRQSGNVFLSAGARPLTRQRVWQMVKESSRRHASPHMLRHSAATHMVENGADLRTVQTILGHADIGTTQIYTHMKIDHLRNVFKAHHPRGRRAK
jgi:integrase/recombinase XerD